MKCNPLHEWKNRYQESLLMEFNQAVNKVSMASQMLARFTSNSVYESEIRCLIICHVIQQN